MTRAGADLAISRTISVTFYRKAQSRWQQKVRAILLVYADNVWARRKLIHFCTIAILTGHCTFDRHAEKLVIPPNDFSRSYKFKKADGDVFHLMH